MLATGIDHALIFVRDLERAHRLYQRLGFILTPLGRHSGLSTANHCIMLERDYFELITVLTPTAANVQWTALLEAGEGLGAAALACRDARAVYRELIARGLHPPDPINFGRPVPLPDGPREARFCVCYLPDEVTPALPGFFCEHKTPDLVWRPEYQHHPNGARRIRGLVVAHPAPLTVAETYRSLLGNDAVTERKGGLSLRYGSTGVLLLTPAEIQRRLGPTAASGAMAHRPVSLSLEVDSLATAQSWLTDHSIPFRPFGPASILIEPQWTAGVYLELLAIS